MPSSVNRSLSRNTCQQTLRWTNPFYANLLSANLLSANVLLAMSYVLPKRNIQTLSIYSDNQFICYTDSVMSFEEKRIIAVIHVVTQLMSNTSFLTVKGVFTTLRYGEHYHNISTIISIAAFVLNLSRRCEYENKSLTKKELKHSVRHAVPEN